MKKLMVAVAIVCAAAFVHAAQYNWGASDVCTGFGAGGATDNNVCGTAYLFLNSGSTAYADVVSAVQAGTFIESYAASALDHRAIIDSKVIMDKSADGKPGATGDSFYLVFVADSWTQYNNTEVGGKVDPAQAFVSDKLTPTMVQTLGPTPLDFGSFYEGTYGDTTGSGWYAQSVPEPTSGLLLLLGVAGLALRRRRA